MKNTKINFNKNIQASVSIEDLRALGWEIDTANESDTDTYHVDIMVDRDGNTTWCLTNTKKAANGIWEGSDSEPTGDNEQTVKDLRRLHDDGKLWDVKEYDY